MKTALVLLISVLTLWGAKIDDFAAANGYLRDYKPALEQAKKENKLIMLVMVADYCPWCRKMEHKTLEDSAVAAKVKSEFVPVIVDRNLDKAHYPEAYDTPRIPTVFFINPHTETHIYESIAYVKKDEYLQTLGEVRESFLKKGEE